MEILNTSEWRLILFDVLGVWLLVRPSDLVNLWSAHRVPTSQWDRFTARLVGVIMLSVQVANLVGRAKNTEAELIMHWPSIIFGLERWLFLDTTSWGPLGPNPTDVGKWMKRGDASCYRNLRRNPESATEQPGKSIGGCESCFRSLFLAGFRLAA